MALQPGMGRFNVLNKVGREVSSGESWDARKTRRATPIPLLASRLPKCRCDGFQEGTFCQPEKMEAPLQVGTLDWPTHPSSPPHWFYPPKAFRKRSYKLLMPSSIQKSLALVLIPLPSSSSLPSDQWLTGTHLQRLSVTLVRRFSPGQRIYSPRSTQSPSPTSSTFSLDFTCERFCPRLHCTLLPSFISVGNSASLLNLISPSFLASASIDGL
jgi:hypothetical protein